MGTPQGSGSQCRKAGEGRERKQETKCEEYNPIAENTPPKGRRINRTSSDTGTLQYLINPTKQRGHSPEPRTRELEMAAESSHTEQTQKSLAVNDTK